MAVLGLYPHEDICTKLAVSPEVETLCQKCRPRGSSDLCPACWTSHNCISQSFCLSHNPLSTPPGTALTGGQLEILGGGAKYSRALMLHSSGKGKSISNNIWLHRSYSATLLHSETRSLIFIATFLQKSPWPGNSHNCRLRSALRCQPYGMW